MHRTRRIVLTLSALLAVAPLASCAAPTRTAEPTASVSTSAQNGGPVSSQHNDADTMFAQMMIVHHEGAIEMAEAALTNAGSAEIKALAERISAAQGPEIDQMTSWLQAWGEPTEAGGHAGHGGMAMNGMTQEEMMTNLEGLSGAEFDKAFLEGMIAHHEGAVEMSEVELTDGENPEAKALAEKIIADQKAEIEEMQGLLTN